MMDLLAVFGGGTGVAAIIVSVIKLRTQRLKLHEKENIMLDTVQAIADTLQRNTNVLTAVSDAMVNISATMTILQDQLEMLRGSEINRNREEIMKIKEVGWYKQRHEFYHKMEDIISANGLSNKPIIIQKIAGAIDESIRETDAWLVGFGIRGYLADTQDKIDFVCSSGASSVLYDIITNSRNLDDNRKMRANLSSYYTQVLGMVKKEFYDAYGRVKRKEVMFDDYDRKV
jgi:hypothetical protein